MAWHVRTALDDAVWRSEAQIPLGDGATPPGYVEELAARLDAPQLTGLPCTGPSRRRPDAAHAYRRRSPGAAT